MISGSLRILVYLLKVGASSILYLLHETKSTITETRIEKLLLRKCFKIVTLLWGLIAILIYGNYFYLVKNK